MDADLVAEFRAVMGRFATGVTIVSTRVAGFDHAMTANSFSSVSLDPLMVLVCVERDTRFHEAVVDSSHWGVSVLSDLQRRHAVWFATRGRPLLDQFAQVPFDRGPVSGAPLVRGALASFECRTVDLHEAGDHDVLIGEVVTLNPVEQAGRPLLYWASNYHHLGTELPDRS